MGNFFFGSIDDDRGGCRCHADQSPERSFVLLAMVSKEFESQKAKPWAKREVEESVERIEGRGEREGFQRVSISGIRRKGEGVNVLWEFYVFFYFVLGAGFCI